MNALMAVGCAAAVDDTLARESGEKSLFSKKADEPFELDMLEKAMPDHGLHISFGLSTMFWIMGFRLRHLI